MAREDFNAVWANDADQFEEPPSSTIDSGWEGGPDKDPPEAKWENWWHNRVDEALQDIEQEGAPEWLGSAVYQIGAVARADDGNLYTSVTGNNTGNNPSSDDGSNWVEAATVRNGLGAPRSQESTDLNSIQQNGFYLVDNSAPNRPSGGAGTLQPVLGNAAGTVVGGQTFYDYQNQVVYQRMRQSGGSFASWYKYHTDTNLAVAASVSGDLDNITRSGTYFATSYTSGPAGTTSGFLEVTYFDSNTILQRFYDRDSENVFYRQKTTGGWQDWKRVVYDSERLLGASMRGTVSLPGGNGIGDLTVCEFTFAEYDTNNIIDDGVSPATSFIVPSSLAFHMAKIRATFRGVLAGSSTDSVIDINKSAGAAGPAFTTRYFTNASGTVTGGELETEPFFTSQGQTFQLRIADSNTNPHDIDVTFTFESLGPFRGSSGSL